MRSDLPASTTSHECADPALRGGRSKASARLGAPGVRASTLGVAGAGFAALACAHYALAAGLRPVLIVPQDGSTGAVPTVRFSAHGCQLDRFHVPIERSDTALCGLLADLGLLHQLSWRRTDWGIDEGGRIRRAQSRADLLALQLGEWSSRRLERLLGRVPRRFAGSGAADVAPRCCNGERTYSWHHRDRRHPHCPTCGRPHAGLTLRGMLLDWVGHAHPIHGHLRGGYRGLHDALLGSLLARGAEVIRGVQLQGIEADANGVTVDSDGGARRFDALVSTLPLPALAKLARGRIVRQLPFPEAETATEISAVAILQTEPRLPYLTHVPRSSAYFSRIYSAASVLPRVPRGRHYPVYFCAPRRAPETPPRSSSELREEARVELLRLCPELEERDVASVHVFRAQPADITWSPEHLQSPPPRQVGDTRLLLCTAARDFPRKRSVDTSIMLARETVSALRNAF